MESINNYIQEQNQLILSYAHEEKLDRKRDIVSLKVIGDIVVPIVFIAGLVIGCLIMSKR